MLDEELENYIDMCMSLSHIRKQGSDDDATTSPVEPAETSIMEGKAPADDSAKTASGDVDRSPNPKGRRKLNESNEEGLGRPDLMACPRSTDYESESDYDCLEAELEYEKVKHYADDGFFW